MRSRFNHTSRFSFGPGPLTPAVKWLLWINVGVFLAMALGEFDWVTPFGLTPAAVLGRGHIWQVVTYMFLHGGFWHLFMNMFALWMFGVTLERRWGTEEFLQFYLTTGIGAGIITWLLSMGSATPIIGASGAIFAVLVAFGMTFPNQPILIWFLFPVPAKIFVAIFGLLELLALRGGQDGVSHITHLAGLALGFIYLKAEWRPLKHWRRLRARLKGGHLKVVRLERPEPPQSDAEIDAILDKISREGIDSLTEAEYQKLRQRSSGD